MDDKLWISLVGLALSVATFLIGRFASYKASGEKSGYLASDIGYIKAGIDDLKTELKAIKVEIAEISTRLARVEESTKQAHKRIDEIVKKYEA